jgi:ribonuclease HI
MLKLYFDGAAVPNPGLATYGWILERNGEKVAKGWGSLDGKRTSNEAEYAGLAAGLTAALERCEKGEAVKACGDSRLVIRQSAGEWAIRSERLVRPVARVWGILEKFEEEKKGPVTFHWIAREKNADADRLTKRALVATIDERHIGEMNKET